MAGAEIAVVRGGVPALPHPSRSANFLFFQRQPYPPPPPAELAMSRGENRRVVIVNKPGKHPGSLSDRFSSISKKAGSATTTTTKARPSSDGSGKKKHFGGQRKRRQPLTKSSLDKELDQYMMSDATVGKARLDQDLSTYMQKSSQQSAATAMRDA